MELGVFLTCELSKKYFSIVSVSLFLMLIFAGKAFAEPPEKLDFIGGYYENGVYKCYSEPCFRIHKGKEAALSRIRPFDVREWLPKRGSKNACQQGYTRMLAHTSQKPVAYLEKGQCQYVVDGEWIDSYTLKNVNVSNIAIDQRISLEEAHRYGGSTWPRSKRMQFAYAQENLIPVSKESKKLRKGQSASQWMPQNKGTWCDYIVRRDIVARKFKLHFPENEKEYNKKIKTLYCKF